MKYYKYIYYLYLGIAALFLCDGMMKFSSGQEPWTSLIFFVLAVFMFFFRRKNIQKMEREDKRKEN